VEAQLVLLSSGSCFSYAEVESLLQEVAASLQSCAALLSTSAGQPGNTEDLQELYMMAVHVGQVSLALKAWRPCAEATGAAVTFATATKLKEAQAQVSHVFWSGPLLLDTSPCSWLCKQGKCAQV
jgi:hypothetical protein